MGFNQIIVSLLEKILTQRKKETVQSEHIVNELRRDNLSTVIKLDTSKTALEAINLNTIMGGIVRSCTVLNAGGGLYLQTSIGDAFEVFKGDVLVEEEIEVLRWYGAGAGTAIIRITGLRL